MALTRFIEDLKRETIKLIVFEVVEGFGVTEGFEGASSVVKFSGALGGGGACLRNSSMKISWSAFRVIPLTSRIRTKFPQVKSVNSSKYDWTKGPTGSVGVRRTFK